MGAFDPQLILTNISNNTYDILRPEFTITVRILLRNKGLKYVLHPRAYPHTSDQYILITYKFFLVELKFW